MLDTTVALENFLKFHMPAGGDCKVLRRIECAIRGEELYRTFSSAPPRVAKLLYTVFDYITWTLVLCKKHGPVPDDITTKYELARATIEKTHSDVAINGLAVFSDFVRKYILALSVQKSDYFETLPEESSHEHVRAVCGYYRACQTDVFPRFVQQQHLHDATVRLPSHHTRLPENLPFFLCVPDDKLLILCDAAFVLLGA